MKKILNSLLLIFLFPFKFFKKTKIDSFVGGLIFGAIFSLVINIVTVKTQEIINRQRVFEALEREMISHLFYVNYIYDEYEKINKSVDEEIIYTDILFNKRFSTRVWNTSEAMKYLFELNPEASLQVETYYDAIVDAANGILDFNQEDYNELWRPCEPYYSEITKSEPQRIDYCNQITRNFSVQLITVADFIIEHLENTLVVFHPTQDRLDSLYLRLLMGDKSVEIMKNQ